MSKYVREYASGSGLTFVVAGMFGALLGWVNAEYLNLPWWGSAMLVVLFALPIILFIAVPISNLVVHVYDDMTNYKYKEVWEPKKRK